MVKDWQKLTTAQKAEEVRKRRERKDREKLRTTLFPKLDKAKWRRNNVIKNAKKKLAQQLEGFEKGSPQYKDYLINSSYVTSNDAYLRACQEISDLETQIKNLDPAADVDAMVTDEEEEPEPTHEELIKIWKAQKDADKLKVEQEEKKAEEQIQFFSNFPDHGRVESEEELETDNELEDQLQDLEDSDDEEDNEDDDAKEIDIVDEAISKEEIEALEERFGNLSGLLDLVNIDQNPLFIEVERSGAHSIRQTQRQSNLANREEVVKNTRSKRSKNYLLYNIEFLSGEAPEEVEMIREYHLANLLPEDMEEVVAAGKRNNPRFH